MDKRIEKSDQWGKVRGELEREELKARTYDEAVHNLLFQLWVQTDATVLDYGSGAGVFTSLLKRLGMKPKAFDISSEMRAATAERIGADNVFTQIEDIPEAAFDVVVCNLVLCIVDDTMAAYIMKRIQKLLRPRGIAIVGFCNPEIFQVHETKLDIRYPVGESYGESHVYLKIKKEGNYEIAEHHRPLGWYSILFWIAGFRTKRIVFTPEYELNNQPISDFAIFALQKR